jgi:phosphoribosyl 1,2-cyclic phosphate phosphodiesterase
MVVKNSKPDFYLSRGGLVPHIVKPNHEFYLQGVKIVPLKMLGHNATSYGYIINDEIVHLGDFKTLASSAIERIMAIKPKLLVMPLTIVDTHRHHVGLKEAMTYVEMFNPERVVFNHMASECDYDYVNEHTPEYVEPAYDNLVVEL